MKNTEARIFDEKTIELMINPEKWKIISSFIAPEWRPLRNAQYMKWAEKNHDRHEHREILFSLKGNFFQSFQGRCYQCTPGTLFLFDAFEEHDRNYPTHAPSLLHLWMSLARNSAIVNLHYLEPGAGIVKSKRFIPGHSETEILLRTWNLLSEKRQNISGALKRARIASALSNIFLYIVDRDTEVRKKNDTAEHQKKVIEIIMNHIRDNISGANNLDKLAHMAGYSKYHFFRIFKEYTGETVHSYINSCRIARVRNMRKEGFSQKDISNALGFSCPPAFANWYKGRKLSL